MRLPEGKKREEIQSAIDAWRDADKGMMRGMLECALYNAVAPYLPDTSSNLGLLATMAPTMIGTLIGGKKLDDEEVMIWADEEGEARIGRCPEPPEDAIRIPFGLLRNLMQMHGVTWAARAMGEQAFNDAEKNKKKGDG